MRVIKTRVYDGRNIYSHKKCIRIDVDLDGYCDIPSKDIEDFNFNLVSMIPELKSHRCGIDEERGFVKRLTEGTYLAHICEHIIIAIQNRIGIEVCYGKSREIQEDIYYIVVEYSYPQVAIESINLAVDIINSLINKNPINYDDRIEFIKGIMKNECLGPSTKSICDAAKEVGLPIIKLGSGDFYQIGYGKQGRIIEASIASTTSCISVDISCDKLLTKELLNMQNIPVASGGKVYNIIGLLKQGEEIGYPLVLKPQYGSKGNGVVLNIKNEKELLHAYEGIKEKFKDIMLEKYYEGNDYRVCVVNYKVIAASLRKPPYVIGDGKRNILELINDLNNNPLRGEDHEKPLTKVKIDNELVDCLTKQEVSLSDIISEGKSVYLRKNANLSTGGEGEDCSDIICNENKELCIRAAKAIGLDICGIDICAKDISKPIYNSGIIMEVNAAPGLRMHVNPIKGKAKEVGKEIVNMMYDNNPHNIPVIAVTGTNGKTTTTRLISYTLSKMGYCVGMTSTEGVYINKKCVHQGDDTGYQSAKCVLTNRDVEVAVLETARGGILKKGLAYDLADVAVITNITEDHLGIDGINTMEELCYVKSLVGEAVKEYGYVVLNAEDDWSHEILPRIKANKIFFSKDKTNKLILDAINNNGIAIYLENGYITVSNNGRVYRICKSEEVPITLGDKLSFNIENILAACGALVAIKIDYCMIKNGLKNYLLNSIENKGRFNCYNLNGINIIFDYGHNLEGYKSVLRSVKNINKGKIIGVIGIPGDRSDDMAIEIGRVSEYFLDDIIIKEDSYKRGRDEGEMARLILSGVKINGSHKAANIVLDEVEAFKFALKKAEVNDTIIVFYERLDPLMDIIKSIGCEERNWNKLKINLL